MDNKENKILRMGGVVEISSESCCDHTLADYFGDVRRILFTECSLKQSGTFSGGGVDEFPGIVVFDVVYLDADGKPTHVSFTSDYELKLKGDEGRARAICTPYVVSYHVRSTGPRRFSAGATVGASVRCIVEDEISSCGSAFDIADRVQTLEGELTVRCAVESERVEREFAEKVERLDGVVEDELEVILSGACASVKEITPEEGGVRARGELCLYALASCDGAPLYLAQKSVAFDEHVPFEGVFSDMKFIPFTQTVSVSHAVNADESGCELVINAIVELRVIGEYNSHHKALFDAFVAGGEVENVYRDFRYTSLNDCCYESVSGNYEIPSSKICEDTIRDIPYICAEAKVNTAMIKDGEIVAAGELRASGVASVVNEAGEISYAGIKFNIPFEERASREVKNEDARVDCNVSVSSICAVVDTDSVNVSYTLALGAVCSEVKTCRLLSESDACECSSAEGKTVTVYYPKSGETLFEVAKKFRSSVSAIAAANDLSVSASANSNPTLTGVDRLFIY